MAKEEARPSGEELVITEDQIIDQNEVINKISNYEIGEDTQTLNIDPSFKVFTVYPNEDDSGCHSVHFGTNSGISKIVDTISSGAITQIESLNACALKFRLEELEGFPYVAVVMEMMSADKLILVDSTGIFIEMLPPVLKGSMPLVRDVSWGLNLPLRSDKVFELKVHKFLSKKKIKTDLYSLLENRSPDMSLHPEIVKKTIHLLLKP